MNNELNDELTEIRSQGLISLAERLAEINKKLQDLIDDTGKLMKNLGKKWDGDAYKISNDYFQQFVNEYPKKYDEVIKEYIKVLKDKVPEVYKKRETESAKKGNDYRF